MIRRQEFLFAVVTKHACESLIDGDGFTFRVTSKYSVCRIIYQRSIERLRMAQGFSRLFQFRPQFLLVQRLTNRYWQLRNAVSVHIASIAPSAASLAIDSLPEGISDEEQRSFLQFPMEDLQCLGPLLHARAGVLGHNHIVGL